ncbi:MAG: hypothetical protein DRN15_09865 [Thermoprotei archaeon]|nr:MAG: hypothetical protein DRN15_09865 [Thermoprotei archaeon]
MTNEEKERRIEISDVEEVRGILKAIADFLKDIREPIKDLLDTLMGSLRGYVLGEDVANFYKKLKEAGIDDNKAYELTRQYLSKRMLTTELIDRLLSGIGRRLS